MGQRKEGKALGGRVWAALLSFGLIGQIAWVVENMYFNVFLYNTITGDRSEEHTSELQSQR